MVEALTAQAIDDRILETREMMNLKHCMDVPNRSLYMPLSGSQSEVSPPKCYRSGAWESQKYSRVLARKDSRTDEMRLVRLEAAD